MANESWILYNNLIKDATIVVSTETANHEREKLTDGMIKSTWRSTVITSTTITLDFGTATAIDGMSFHFHNIESGDTTYVWEASINNFSTTSETETITLVTRTVKEINSNGTLTDVTRRDLYHIDSWNYRYYRLRIVKASGSYIEGGQLGVWKDYYQFAQNFNQRYTWGKQSVFAGSRTASGHLSRSLKNSSFYLPMTFENITDAQKDILEEAGQSNYICYYHGMTGKLFWGGFTCNPAENIRTSDAVTPAETWRVQTTFEESF